MVGDVRSSDSSHSLETECWACWACQLGLPAGPAETHGTCRPSPATGHGRARRGDRRLHCRQTRFILLGPKGPHAIPSERPLAAHGCRVINGGLSIVSGPAHSHKHTLPPASACCLICICIWLMATDAPANMGHRYCATVLAPQSPRSLAMPHMVDFSWDAPFCFRSQHMFPACTHVKRVKRLWRGVPALCPPPSFGLAW